MMLLRPYASLWTSGGVTAKWEPTARCAMRSWIDVRFPPGVHELQVRIRRRDAVMGKRKFNDDEISDILKQHQGGVTVADVCHRHGISEPTFYRWQSMQFSKVGFEVKRLRALEQENQKLKKLLAAAMLAAATLSEMLEKTSNGRA
jgi:putative transposase